MTRLIALLGLLALAACAGEPLPPPRVAEIGFADRGPIALEATRIEVRDAVVRDGTLEARLPSDPKTVALRWPADRLRAVSGASPADRFASYVVKDARVIEEKLRRTTGITGAFTRDQSERYTVVVEVAIEIRTLGGGKEGEATARVQRAITVREDATPNQRDQDLHDLVERAMRELDLELERNTRAYLTRFML